mgnify:CR=1 FL=1
MEYSAFLELAKENISNLIYVGDGSFETYKEDVERFEAEYEDIIKQYDLTESELFVMFMMFIKNYSDIQQQFFPLGKSTLFSRECVHQYDSFLSKVPVSVSPMHYRLERYYKIADFEQILKLGQTFICHHYLTASSTSAIFEKLGDGVKMYINRPIIDKASKAHEVFKIYNATNEYQVNFERNTRFQIDSIDKRNRIVNLTEL